VYPSQYEGFGIPPLEAMSQGCPVICSRATSIPEVVGEAGAYFDPQDVDSIRDALERTLQSVSVRDGLIEAGYQRSQAFSWDHCARETLSAYQELLQ
jgi:glycosyltransferase involved in cell wall biosynthesis